MWNVYELFHTRFSLHKRAYQHRVSTVVDHMFAEVLELANPHVDLTCPSTGRTYRMSTCIESMGAYATLSDWIILRIQHSTCPALSEARVRKARRRCGVFSSSTA